MGIPGACVRLGFGGVGVVGCLFVCLDRGWREEEGREGKADP